MKSSIAFALVALVGLSPATASARDSAGDCQILKQIVDDAGNSFRNVRLDDQVNDMDTAKTYPVDVAFSDSQWCSVTISVNFFNENYGCDLRNTSMDEAEAFVKSCLGESAIPDPEYQEDHFKLFRLSSGAGSVSIFEGYFKDLVKITIDAAERK